MMRFLLRLWAGPLPDQELFPTDRKVNPFLHWAIHPIKRRLAKYYLRALQTFFNLKVIAITGSAGKTTTKNLLLAALGASHPTVATADNITSTYNIPSTILKTRPWTKFLILEMGVEYPGDMDFYTWLARPDIAIILNVNYSHTRYMGSVENVAREKSKIFCAMPRPSTAVINSDDPRIKSPINIKSLAFGRYHESFCQIVSSQITKNLATRVKLIVNQQPLTCNLRLIGEHLAYNLAATVTVAYALGINLKTITPPLESVAPPPHRFSPIFLPQNSVIIDDTYNANPLAVRQSLTTLSTLTKLTKKSPVFVFAQMNDLGRYEKSAHSEIGLYLKSRFPNLALYCLGPATRHTIKAAGFGKHFKTEESLLTEVKKCLSSPTPHLALIKGSHSWHLENLVQKLITT